jgi:hypothetical protein
MSKLANEIEGLLEAGSPIAGDVLHVRAMEVLLRSVREEALRTRKQMDSIASRLKTGPKDMDFYGKHRMLSRDGAVKALAAAGKKLDKLDKMAVSLIVDMGEIAEMFK